MFNVKPLQLKNANPQIDNLREESFKGHKLYQHMNTYYLETVEDRSNLDPVLRTSDTLYLRAEALETVLGGEDSGYPIYVCASFDDGSSFWGTPSEFKDKATWDEDRSLYLLRKEDCDELLPWEQDEIAKKGPTVSTKGPTGKFSERLFTFLEQCSEPVGATEIAEALERPTNAITTRLKVLTEQGQIQREKNSEGRFVYSRQPR